MKAAILPTPSHLIPLCTSLSCPRLPSKDDKIVVKNCSEKQKVPQASSRQGSHKPRPTEEPRVQSFRDFGLDLAYSFGTPTRAWAHTHGRSPEQAHAANTRPSCSRREYVWWLSKRTRDARSSSLLEPKCTQNPGLDVRQLLYVFPYIKSVTYFNFTHTLKKRVVRRRSVIKWALICTLVFSSITYLICEYIQIGVQTSLGSIRVQTCSIQLKPPKYGP